MRGWCWCDACLSHKQASPSSCRAVAPSPLDAGCSRQRTWSRPGHPSQKQSVVLSNHAAGAHRGGGGGWCGLPSTWDLAWSRQAEVGRRVCPCWLLRTIASKAVARQGEGRLACGWERRPATHPCRRAAALSRVFCTHTASLPVEKKGNEAARRVWIFLLASLQSAWCHRQRREVVEATPQHLID